MLFASLVSLCKTDKTGQVYVKRTYPSKNKSLFPNCGSQFSHAKTLYEISKQCVLVCSLFLML